MHGEPSKQKPKWGSVTPGWQREGEVLFVRRHWGASPQRNAAYNRRPDWPHRQHKELHHWLTLAAASLTALSHTSIQMQIGDRHKHTITKQLIMGQGAETQSQQSHSGGERELSDTHRRREVHQSCRSSRPLHHSTNDQGCSVRWCSETHSGSKWMQLHRRWRKAYIAWRTTCFS